MIKPKTPMEFCYWLHGYFELSALPQVDERGRARAKEPVTFLSEKHVERIKRNLEAVINFQENIKKDL